MTGAMLMYSGAMSIAMYRTIRAGRRWAVGVAAATSLVFWLYLMLLLPLPGTGGTVPPMLGLWSAYLLWLGAAFLAIVPGHAADNRCPRSPMSTTRQQLQRATLERRNLERPS